MSVLLQIDFPADGPWGEEMALAYAELADSIAAEPGLRWKVWTERGDEQLAGGVYLFDTEENARAYLAMHTERLAGFGITDVRALVLDVNEPLSRVTRAPLG